MVTALYLAALLALSLALLRLRDLLPEGLGFFPVLLALLAAFACRWYLLERLDLDAAAPARSALEHFGRSGGVWGLRSCTAPFSLGMQYLLALCSYAGEGSLRLYKYLCVAGELAAAWACQRCVAAVTVKPARRRAAFVMALLLPAGLLQGAGALGDSLRWVFLLWAAASVLEGRFRLTGALLGLAAAFHPGALWLLPIFWIFPAVRRHWARTLAWLALSYALALAPALGLGRPGALTLPFWPGVAATRASALFAGAPGLYSLSGLTPGAATGLGAYAAAGALVLLCLSGRAAAHDRRRQLAGLCLMALAVGGLLPWQSAGALFPAEGLTLALCCLDPLLFPAALGLSGASALAVTRRLLGAGLVPWPLWWASAALLGAGVVLLLYVLFKRNG